MKVTNIVTMIVAVPEIDSPVCIALPHAPILDAIAYELEEIVRRQSFARRYGMTLDCALAGVPPAPHLRVKLDCGGER